MRPNESELEVLRVLWEEAPLKPAEIQRRFGRPIDNGTLRSLLVAMVDRRLLRREKAGRAFVYSPRVTRRRQLSATVRRLAEVFAGGSTGSLVMELLRTERLSADELRQLRAIVGGEER